MRWLYRFPTLLAVLLLAGCAIGPDDWRADLRDLHRQLAERHVDLYHSVSKEELDRAVADLDRRIPELSPPEILVGFAQVLALVGDGHTSLYPANQRKWWFRHFPIKLWSFSDGIHVTATTPEHTDLFGKRLVRIDETPIEEAYRRISTTIGADNDMEYEYTVPFELTRPEMLHALGIAHSAEQAELVFEGGVRRTFRPFTERRWRKLDWRSANSLYGGQKPPSMRVEALFATPLTLEHLRQRKYYWFTWLEDQRTVFLQYNACWDQKDRPTFARVVAELFQELDREPGARLVVDLRQNTGGEPLIALPLIEGLEVVRPLRLFHLTLGVTSITLAALVSLWPLLLPASPGSAALTLPLLAAALAAGAWCLAEGRASP